MRLKTKRTVISTFLKKDIDEEYISWLNNKNNFKFSRHKNKNFSKKNIIKEFYNYKKKRNIEFLKFSVNKKKIGTLILYLDRNNLTMSLGILLGDTNYLGRGIAREVCSKIVNYFFSIKKYNRIIIGTNIENKSMKGICESLGFRVFKEINNDSKVKKIYYVKEKKKNLGVICRDPGAANLIFHYISNDNNNLYYIYSRDQAFQIFNKLRKKKNVFFSKNFLEIKNNVTQVIIGTGSSQFEKNYLHKLKKIKIRCISVVDHITAIRDRYIFRNKMIIPDIIWTFDDYVFKQVKKTIKTKVILKKNYFLHSFKKIISVSKKKKVILYLCEPHKISKDKRRYDFESLDFFFSYLQKKKFFKFPIYLKVHPKENKKRYNRLIKKYKNFFQIKILDKKSLIECLKISRIVFGLSSYALNLAANLGIPTFRCFIKDQKINVLPNKKIKNFQYFLQNEKSYS